MEAEGTEGVEDSTAAEGDFTAVEEDFTEVGEAERSAGVEDSTAEAALGRAAYITTAELVEGDITEAGAVMVAGATTEVGAVTVGVAGATDGAEDIGAEDTVTDGAGESVLGGRIGDGDIRMGTITARGITGRTVITLTRTTVLRTIPETILIRTIGTTTRHLQIPTHDRDPIRTDRPDPGDLRYRKAERMQTTEIVEARPVRRVDGWFPLTG